MKEHVDGMLVLKLKEEEWKEHGVASGLDRTRVRRWMSTRSNPPRVPQTAAHQHC